MKGRERDAEKARYWREVIRDAARSGMSIRAFCRQRKLRTRQFYWWQRRLKESRQLGSTRSRETPGTSFALVSEDGALDAGIELVLEGGRRLRIRKGVDEDTLRAVLAAMGPERC